MVRKVVPLLLVLLLVLSVVYSVFLYQQNLVLSNENSILKEEITTLKSANLVTALGVVEIPPYEESYWGGNGNSSYLWITGWVFNCGGSLAANAGLNVLAFNYTNHVLMNVTVPLDSRSGFATATKDYLVPKVPYWLPGSALLSELEYSTILGQQNMTVRFSLYHEGSFPSSTRYEMNPIWENPQ